MNFAADVVERSSPEALGLVELTRDGGRREWTFGEIAQASARLAGAFSAHGLRTGDVALIWIGNRADWVLSMLACFRLGIVAAAVPEQLRARDLKLRLDAVSPGLIVADERNREELALVNPECPVLWVPDHDLFAAHGAEPPVSLSSTDPCLVTFTSGTSGTPKPVVHVQRYLFGQALQAEHWMGVQRADVAWCTASSGWSKSARNAFVAPWLHGGTALVHDARFDPQERLELITREGVGVLCMAPTEYRIIAKRTDIPPLPSVRALIAAGEALDPGVIAAWREATGAEIRDGYGQTETGQVTGFRPGEPVRPGSMGRPLPGVRLSTDDGELVVDPSSVPTFFHGYGGEAPAPRDKPWRTGDRVAVDDDGYVWFEGRADDVIISAGYRIGPFEVESALASHPAVEEAAAVAAPDEERGAVVRGVVVLRDGYTASEELGHQIQAHVKTQTAPYKYPRRLDFVERLPKTTSGKIKRGELRRES